MIIAMYCCFHREVEALGSTIATAVTMPVKQNHLTPFAV